MPDALRLSLAFVVSACAVLLATPIAIRMALGTGFLDHPVDYKRHARPTPYLGGGALVVALVPVALLLGGTGSTVGWILAGTVLMWIVGTIDDRIPLGPLTRLALEAGVGAGIWAVGLGWSAFNSDVASLALTIIWVVGVVNAFNLMDNLDGAAATVGGISAGGVAVAALIEGSPALAAVALALSGACAAFLVYNLQQPARIFLGDGGSMTIGFLLAALVMAVSRDVNGLGAAAVVAAAPLVGLVILDTTLVVVSRTRRGVKVMSGGRDHITHRLLGVLGSPRRVALALAGLQVALCGLGLVLLQGDTATVIGVGIVYIALGAIVVMVLDLHRFTQPEWHPAPPVKPVPSPRASEPALARSTARQEYAP